MSDAETFRERVRIYLCNKADNGTRYITAKKASTEIDATSKRIGNALGFLADDGLVQKWSAGSTGNTWEITIDQ